MKHTHHNFDIDRPGKDSHEHRLAGATEVLLTGAKRWALLPPGVPAATVLRGGGSAGATSASAWFRDVLPRLRARAACATTPTRYRARLCRHDFGSWLSVAATPARAGGAGATGAIATSRATGTH